MKLRRIEAIVASAITLFVIVIIYGQHTKNWEEKSSYFLAKPFIEKGLTFNFYQHHLLPLILYVCLFYMAFLIFNNWIIPKFIETRRFEKALVTSLLIIFLLWFGFAFCEWARHLYKQHAIWSYFGEDKRVATPLFFLVLFLTIYTLIKAGIIYLFKQKDNLTSRIAQESLIGSLSIATIFSLMIGLNGKMAFFWLMMSTYLFIMYCIEVYKLLPFCTRYNYNLKRYLYIRIPLSLLVYLPFGTILSTTLPMNFQAFLVIWVCTNVVSIPVIRYIYQQKLGNMAKLLNLETALGESTASLNFLRSQINPHFLFNILNTLYGTALIEEAERTASGIQKLGDMMRFMLHENTQDKILLVREVEYLYNYIDLQKLRTDTSKNIRVDQNIQEVDTNYHIAPMLLIPFIENAFKHGISLNERSWIKVTLYINDNKLFFDVYNSIHQKPSSDLEKNHSGIGLQNVKQRLLQIYPGQHELIIRQTNEEYFIHLTLAL
ncbi:sensor histidine kinase [Olivibacter domesticus]|uniref:GHKL domain-containing protein n=1 Tax=Olivibacter domesticus TaxID=407022 RepID=A0A1H7LV93_OLID1|nr:histidine kinase [Olivibacter domesticus]SEL02779.1 GHKL domain-containing protein [Olivibacter domesticus]